MNGPPVCPSRKTENAPTWRSPRPLFWGSFLAHFRQFPRVLGRVSVSSHSNTTTNIYFILFLFISQQRYGPISYSFNSISILHTI